MQDSSRPVTGGYPVQNFNGCAPPPTSAASYSYTYYPPPPLPPQNSRPQNSRFLVAYTVFLSIVLTILVIYTFVLRPQFPQFTIQSLSISNFNASNQRVNATWNARFQVSNPDKKLSVSYGDVVSSIFHADCFLSETRIGPFVQGPGNVSSLEATYSIVESLVDGKVVDEMNAERSRGEMKFGLNMIAYLVFRYNGWRSVLMFTRVLCDEVAVNASSGKMNGGSKKCSINFKLIK